ncbi:hypothetical protein T492DRAFT_1100671 [Pavlovales sp. CCMP2436]|nr:hypothetical protein T492DRAFT_1100671 [Pavlovales sp. CCMP2436]|mmetsp:Transcript_1718/g.4319  ORF Transcript_1718/g.4319 Transcript_1718/m.4319 type:complete len:291 (-) Transcript_1718:271-1143(-)
MSALGAVLAALGQEGDASITAVIARANSADAAELVQLLAEAVPSIGEAIFCGEATAITCSVCHTTKSTTVRTPLIAVDVAAPKQVTLHGAFKYSCDGDIFGDESDPIHECAGSCQKRQPAVKRIHPCAPWPQRLLIAIRRNTFDYPAMANKKVMHRVAFPRVLDLPALCEIPLGVPPPPEYTFVGAVVHTGASAQVGTYSYEANPGLLAILGLDDKQAVQESTCPNGATPYVLVYQRLSETSEAFSQSASVASGSIQVPAEQASKPAPVQAEEHKDETRRRGADCCCSLM